MTRMSRLTLRARYVSARRLAPDERDVRAVECRDDARNHAVGRAVEDLACKIGGGRMRHRVVRMDDIERALPGNMHDAARQREDVLRLAEQRVCRRVDAVK